MPGDADTPDRSAARGAVPPDGLLRMPRGPAGDLQPPFEAYTGTAPFIFVSYAHKDGAIVFPELARLRGLGYRIWYDEGIDPGNEWPEEIAAALQACRHFLVFISPRAVASKNVRDEINFAINREKRVLAVHLEETALPAGLELRMGQVQAVMKYRMSASSYARQMEKALSAEVKDPTPEELERARLDRERREQIEREARENEERRRAEADERERRVQEAKEKAEREARETEERRQELARAEQARAAQSESERSGTVQGAATGEISDARYVLAVLFAVVVFRLSAVVPIPWYDSGTFAQGVHDSLQHTEQGSSWTLLALVHYALTGGAFAHGAIGTLGVMPLLVYWVLGALARPMSRVARLVASHRMTVLALTCALGGFGAAFALEHAHSYIAGAKGSLVNCANLWLWRASCALALGGCSWFIAWLYHRLLQVGFKRPWALYVGVALLSDLPHALAQFCDSSTTHAASRGGFLGVALGLCLSAAMLLLTVGLYVTIKHAARKIPVRHARAGGISASAYMPVCFAAFGMDAVIAATVLLTLVVGALRNAGGVPSLSALAGWMEFLGPSSAAYCLVMLLLVVWLTRVQILTGIKPAVIADGLRREGAYVPGVRPGYCTEGFLRSVLTGLWVAYAAALAICGLGASCLGAVLHLPFSVAQVLGGGIGSICVIYMADDACEPMLRRWACRRTVKHYSGFLHNARLGRRTGQ